MYRKVISYSTPFGITEVIACPKGGVGKTVYSKNLAYLTSLKVNSLWIDMDPRQNVKNLLLMNYVNGTPQQQLPYPWGTFTASELPEKITKNKKVLEMLFDNYSKSALVLKRTLAETITFLDRLPHGLTPGEKNAFIHVLSSTLNTSQLFTQHVRKTAIFNDIHIKGEEKELEDKNIEFSRLYSIKGLHKYHDNLTLAQSIDMMRSIQNIPGYSVKVIDLAGGTNMGIITFLAGTIVSGARIKLVSEPNPDSLEGVMRMIAYLSLIIGIENMNNAKITLVITKFKHRSALRTKKEPRDNFLENLSAKMQGQLYMIKADNYELLSAPLQKELDRLLSGPAGYDFSKYELELIGNDYEGIENTEWRNHIYSKFYTDTVMYTDLQASASRVIEATKKVHKDRILNDTWDYCFEETEDKDYVTWRKNLRGKKLQRDNIELIEEACRKKYGVTGLLALWDETHPE